MSAGRARVLALAHDFPLPADNGSSVRVLNWLRVLGGAADVRLIVHPRPTTTAAHVAELEELSGIEVLLGPSATRPPAKPFVWAESLRTATPPWFVMWSDPRATAAAARQVGWSTHVVALDDFAGHHLPKLDRRGRTTILDKHKVYAATGARGEASAASPFRAVRASAVSRLSSIDERRVLRSADRVVVTTPEEADRLRRHHQRRPDAVIPMAIDDRAAAWDRRTAVSSAPAVAWLGTLDSQPNRDGLLRLLAALRVRRPQFQLVVVGRGVDAELRAAAEGLDVRFCGYVEDLADVLGTVRAAVVALWSGGGIRVKTLQLLASGVPVATTPVGLEGIAAASHGVHCLIGDDEVALVEHLERLVADPAAAAEIGCRGRELVQERYTWERVGEQIIDVVLGG